MTRHVSGKVGFAFYSNASALRAILEQPHFLEWWKILRRATKKIALGSIRAVATWLEKLAEMTGKFLSRENYLEIFLSLNFRTLRFRPGKSSPTLLLWEIGSRTTIGIC